MPMQLSYLIVLINSPSHAGERFPMILMSYTVLAFQDLTRKKRALYTTSNIDLEIPRDKFLAGPDKATRSSKWSALMDASILSYDIDKCQINNYERKLKLMPNCCNGMGKGAYFVCQTRVI